MTYNSKRTLTSMAAGLLLFIAYVIYALGARAPEQTDVKAWATVMLIFIGISVVVAIVIQILFHVAYAIGVAVKERNQSDKYVERIIASSVMEDERDKLIGLKAARIGYFLTGLGAVVALATLALGGAVVAGLHIILGAAAIGSLVEGAVIVYLHERGVRNG